MKLNSWGLVPLQTSPFQPPEFAPKGLTGVVEGNPKFADGDDITTSRLLDVSLVEGKLVAKTASGSVYELGEPDAEYERLYPDAKWRLLNAQRPE